MSLSVRRRALPPARRIATPAGMQRLGRARRGLPFLLGALVWLSPHPSLAADAPSPASPGSWGVTVTPYVWATSFAGNLKTMGQSASFAEPFAAGVSHLDLAGMGAVEATNGVFGILVDGLYIRASQSVADKAFKARVTYDLPRLCPFLCSCPGSVQL